MVHLARLAVGIAVATTLAGAACAYLPGLGGPGPGGQEPAATTAGDAPARGRERLFYWCGTTDENEMKWRSKIDWAERVDFGTAPVRRDIRILYGQFLGHYPLYGLHQAMPAGWMEEHVKKVRKDVEERVPAGFTGLVCIDYENWNPLWDRLVNVPSKDPSPVAADQDYKDDWRDYLKSVTAGWDKLTYEQREEQARTTYNRATKDFFLRTLAACRETRPQARWGFFDFPGSAYGGNELGGRIGYAPDGKGLAAERNDQIAWLFDAVDVVFPTVYCVAYTVPPGEHADWHQATNTVEHSAEYMLGNVREAVRLAKGKPVIAFMWPRYMRPNSKYNEQFLNDINLRQSLELPFEAGADGIAIWESINSADEFPRVQEYIRAKLAPAIEKVARER